MFKVIYSHLIIVALMGLVLVTIIHAEENSEEVRHKDEISESAQEVNEQNQEETPFPRDLADRAPDSIPEQIQEAETIKRSIIKFDPFSRIIQPWRKLNSKLRESIRLEFSLSYTALYQVANKATQGEGKTAQLAGYGIFQVYGKCLQRREDIPRI